jgi:hypothetical protein
VADCEDASAATYLKHVRNRAYQVKVRNAQCLNHGGPLDAVLDRMARWRQGVS